MGEGAGHTIWLVGMMGAGKSAVGRALAALLGLPFVDSDTEVERAAGRPISALFEQEGEARFRQRERGAIEAWAGRAAVVALGGGAIAQPGAAQRLSASGTVVYLKTAPETLLARVGRARTRPLLNGLDDAGRLAEIRRLLEERGTAYESARIVVSTEDRDVAAVAEAVAEELA